MSTSFVVITTICDTKDRHFHHKQEEMLQLSYNRNIFDMRRNVDPVTSNHKYHGDEKWVCQQDFYHLFPIPISLLTVFIFEN